MQQHGATRRLEYGEMYKMQLLHRRNTRQLYLSVGIQLSIVHLPSMCETLDLRPGTAKKKERKKKKHHTHKKTPGFTCNYNFLNKYGERMRAGVMTLYCQRTRFNSSTHMMVHNNL